MCLVCGVRLFSLVLRAEEDCEFGRERLPLFEVEAVQLAETLILGENRLHAEVARVVTPEHVERAALVRDHGYLAEARQAERRDELHTGRDRAGARSEGAAPGDLISLERDDRLTERDRRLLHDTRRHGKVGVKGRVDRHQLRVARCVHDLHCIAEAVLKDPDDHCDGHQPGEARVLIALELVAPDHAVLELHPLDSVEQHIAHEAVLVRPQRGVGLGRRAEVRHASVQPAPVFHGTGTEGVGVLLWPEHVVVAVLAAHDTGALVVDQEVPVAEIQSHVVRPCGSGGGAAEPTKIALFVLFVKIRFFLFSFLFSGVLFPGSDPCRLVCIMYRRPTSVHNYFLFKACLISLSKSSEKPMPAALAACGKSEVSVMPGMVFVSRT